MSYVDKKAGYDIKIHIDVSINGLTRESINEMIGRVKSMGIEEVIKSDVYVASGYSNRYMKQK